MQLKPVADLHAYVAAPFPFNTTLLPAHIDGAVGVTDTVKLEATVTTSVAEALLHDEVVPVTE